MIRIAGAGMAGLLAASMLRSQPVTIYEGASSLPNNHHALLRFRSTAVSDATGIPFRKVQVLKAVDIPPFEGKLRNPVALAIAYSMKVLGKPSIRSITSVSEGSQTRFIAPPDFIGRMADSLSCPIKYGYALSMMDFSRRAGEASPLTISTIPMQHLARLLQYDWGKEPLFNSRPGHVIKVDLAPHFDIYATLYFPSPEFIAYRASITGNQLIIELMASSINSVTVAPETLKIIKVVLEAFGFSGPAATLFREDSVRMHEQRYAKIDPIDDEARKKFIMWATETHNVYSLGRFATWRPGLLLDDVVNDVRVIQRLISGDDSTYDHTLKGFR